MAKDTATLMEDARAILRTQMHLADQLDEVLAHINVSPMLRAHLARREDPSPNALSTVSQHGPARLLVTPPETLHRWQADVSWGAIDVTAHSSTKVSVMLHAGDSRVEVILPTQMALALAYELRRAVGEEATDA